MPARHKAYLYLGFAALIWGVAGPIIKHTLIYFDPILFLTYRFFLSSLILIPILYFTHPHILQTLAHLPPKTYLFLILSSLLGSSINLGLLFWGFSLTTSIDGTLLNATSPVFITLASVYFLKDHLTPRKKLGHLVAFTGTLIILFQPLVESGHLFSGSLYGNLLVLLADMAWAGYIIISKKQLRLHLSPLFLTTFMFLSGFISMFMLLLILNTKYLILNTLTNAPASAHLGVIYMAIFSGSLAYFLFEKGQKTIETSQANLFLYLSPLITTPVAYFWLNEPITFTFIIGGLVIAAGILLAQTQSHRT